MKAFVDTNVYIDFIGNRAAFAEDAKKLCVAAYFGDLELWISTQTIADADYICRKPGDRELLRSKMAASLEIFHVCGTHAFDCEQALTNGWPDIEDYLIAASAKRIKADAIITRDSRGFTKARVPVYSPTELLDHLQTDLGLEYGEIDV